MISIFYKPTKSTLIRKEERKEHALLQRIILGKNSVAIRNIETLVATNRLLATNNLPKITLCYDAWEGRSKTS